MPAAEWVVFRDPTDPSWEWHFDVAFLTSGYHCIFGSGCKGTYGEPDIGCCADGAYLINGKDDDTGEAAMATLAGYVERLTPADWQRHELGQAGWWEYVEDDAGDLQAAKTVRVDGDGPCIFANREGFEGGTGCALHAAALKHGEDPKDWKPDVCWQVPLQVDSDVDARVSVVRAFHNRDDWGDGEHEPLDWWCIDDTVAYDGQQPVWVAMEAELRRMCGDKLYDALARYLRERDLPLGRVPVNFIDLCDPVPADGSTGRPVAPVDA